MLPFFVAYSFITVCFLVFVSLPFVSSVQSSRSRNWLQVHAWFLFLSCNRSLLLAWTWLFQVLMDTIYIWKFLTWKSFWSDHVAVARRFALLKPLLLMILAAFSWQLVAMVILFELNCLALWSCPFCSLSSEQISVLKPGDTIIARNAKIEMFQGPAPKHSQFSIVGLVLRTHEIGRKQVGDIGSFSYSSSRRSEQK